MSVVLDPFTAWTHGIEARLRLFFKADRWAFRVVPDPLSIEELRSLVSERTPLLGLGWRQLNPNANTVGRRFQGAAGLRLTIVVKNPTRAARFLGDGKSPGLYPAMAGAIALLNGYTLVDVGTLFVTACSQAYAQGFGDITAVIATLDLTATIVVGDVTGDGAAAPDFLKQVSEFEPWPEGKDRDEPIDVRTAP
ncbi:MAG: hypothetical protein C0458_15975 [Methylobacterium sp.]|nr:hypothetical protein [Methylobacterium sp.]